MFGLAWDRWLVLIVVALFVLGPERIPAAMQWLGSSVRRVKSFAADAQTKLHAEIGPELAELRKPLADLPFAELRRLRNPRAAVAQFLFADHTATTQPAPSTAPASTSPSSESRHGGAGLVTGQRPPIDPDAT